MKVYPINNGIVVTKKKCNKDRRFLFGSITISNIILISILCLLV